MFDWLKKKKKGKKLIIQSDSKFNLTKNNLKMFDDAFVN